MVYFFSGSLTDRMMDLITKLPDYEPMDVLVTQLDRSALVKMMQWKDEGKIGKLFCDSGAFSHHTGKAVIDVDEYIDYLNKHDKYFFTFAQVDHIPGHFGQPKTPEDYVESARLSWENFLYMRSKLVSPKKLMPVFHYGESFDALRHMLDWRDEDGEPLEFVGISPANDVSQAEKDIYLAEVFDTIKKSSHPTAKTHLYGMTSFQALWKFPTFSCDSISHRLVSAYSKLYLPKYGVVPISRRSRTVKAKSNLSFLDTADEATLKWFEEYIGNLGFTVDDILDDSTARVVVTVYGFMQEIKAINEQGIKPLKKSKRLFSI